MGSVFVWRPGEASLDLKKENKFLSQLKMFFLASSATRLEVCGALQIHLSHLTTKVM